MNCKPFIVKCIIYFRRKITFKSLHRAMAENLFQTIKQIHSNISVITLNYSKTFENQPILTPAFLIGFTSLYGLIFVGSLVGNSIMCLVILRTRYMHSWTNFYMCNLGFSHLVFSCFGETHFLIRI